MRRSMPLLIFLFVISSCKQKELTLEELKKAKWDSLTIGIDHISTKDKNDIPAINDSIELNLKGTSGTDTDLTVMAFKNMPEQLNELVLDMATQYLSDSKAGYLRVNPFAMIRSTMLTGIIYLRGDYDTPFAFISDSTALKNIPGINEVTFISKEMAKQEYLDEGNADWDKVLDANPLPNSIEIKLDKKEWTEESLNDLKSLITNKLTMASNIELPVPFKKSDKYFFFEYKRK